jgi:hypothetical protein
MKLKLSFVTNSSSCNYLLMLDLNEFDGMLDCINELNEDPESCDEGVRLSIITDSLDELNEFVNDKPLDWASRPGGPNFVAMSQENYKICKEIIENKMGVCLVWVDYNVCDKFLNEWQHRLIKDCT